MTARSRQKRPGRKPRGKRKGSAPAVAGYRALFVDDDDGCRALVGDVLSAHGFDVLSESTVDAGLHRAAEEEFDLIILDLMLPSGTGGEAAFKIRELDSDVPILALSGYLDKWDDDDLRALGFTDWMAKPFKTRALAKKALGLVNDGD